MSLDLRRTFRAPKVPEPDGWFWGLKLLSTAMGEATSDYFVHRFNPEVVVLVGLAAFLACLYLQLRAPRYLITLYWLTVTMVAVFGTMAADVWHVALHVPYLVTSLAFALALVAVFVTWQRTEHTLSIHSITTTRRELFYWAAVLATFALGTAVGDVTAYTLNMGYLASILLFAVLIVLPGLGALAGSNRIEMFWTAYVLTRPLGASVADYLGFPHSSGGAGWGHGTVALLFSAAIAGGVARLLAAHHRQRRRRAPSPRARSRTSPTRGSRSRPSAR